MSPSRSGTQSCSGELNGPLCLALVQFFRVDHTFLVGSSESGNRGAQKNAWMLRSASMVPLGTKTILTGEGGQSKTNRIASLKLKLVSTPRPEASANATATSRWHIVEYPLNDEAIRNFWRKQFRADAVTNRMTICLFTLKLCEIGLLFRHQRKLLLTLLRCIGRERIPPCGLGQNISGYNGW